jgi:hypothetical protein
MFSLVNKLGIQKSQEDIKTIIAVREYSVAVFKVASCSPMAMSRIISAAILTANLSRTLNCSRPFVVQQEP